MANVPITGDKFNFGVVDQKRSFEFFAICYRCGKTITVSFVAEPLSWEAIEVLNSLKEVGR